MLPSIKGANWLQCCPYWLIKQPSATEALEVMFYGDKGNLPAIYNAGYPMPYAIKNAYRSCDAGYNEGINEKSKKDQKRKSKQ